MKFDNGFDPAAALKVRGYGALESFEQEFDFSTVAAANAFTIDLLRVESGYPSVVRLVRVLYALPTMAAAWRAGIRQNNAIPNGCRDSLYTSGETNRPGLRPLVSNGFIPSVCATEPNWEVDYLVPAGRQISLSFDFKSKPNVNQAMNPVGKVFIHFARLQ